MGLVVSMIIPDLILTLSIAVILRKGASVDDMDTVPMDIDMLQMPEFDLQSACLEQQLQVRGWCDFPS